VKKTNPLLAIIDRMDTLRKERDEARRLAESWRSAAEEAGTYAEAPFTWEEETQPVPSPKRMLND